MIATGLRKRWIDAFHSVQRFVWQSSDDHGFHLVGPNPLFVPAALALISSEVSEALEAHRTGNNAHVGEELADVVIRVMDLAEVMNIDLGNEILGKVAINYNRPFKHGNKLY